MLFILLNESLYIAATMKVRAGKPGVCVCNRGGEAVGKGGSSSNGVHYHLFRQPFCPLSFLGLALVKSLAQVQGDPLQNGRLTEW